MNPFQLRKKAEEFEISYPSAVRIRIRYLLAQAIQGLDWTIDEAEIPQVMFFDALDEIVLLQKSLNMPVKEGQITDEMIQAARDFPIENIIEFNKGVAIAFCHEDSRPSLSWDRKRNKAHCFPCSRDYDGIQTLIERDGCSFVEAVKRLAGG